MKLRVDVKVIGENTWATNGLRFDTEAEALTYAHDLYRRWTVAELMRIVPENHPDHEIYTAGSEHPDWAKEVHE